MIDYIIGKITNKKNSYITLETNGIGYSIFVPEGRFIISDQTIKVWTYLIHKEDTMALFGFENELEKEIFINLISVNGVGPKLAMQIISSETLENIVVSIVEGNEKILSSIQGLGQKTSKKIILELKEKFKTFAKENNFKNIKIKDDKQEKRIIEALFSLGYKKNESKEILKRINIEEDLSDEEYLRRILIEISKNNK